MSEGTVLILGASGVVGSASIERFAREGWNVVAASRRRPQFVDESLYTFVPLDLSSADATREAIAGVPQVTHVVFAALYEMPGLISGWQNEEQIARNRAMLANLLDALDATGTHIEHISLLQGTKAYGVHVQPMRIPARESQPRVEHRNFYWEQEDLIREWGPAHDTGWTIFRPQFVFGLSTGAAMNLIPIIGLYGAIRKHQGESFAFPGGASYVAEAVDSRLMAGALEWAATAEAARNETFNITNGDVFEWRDLWPALADELGVEQGPDSPLQLATWLLEQEDVWAEIVREHDLEPTTIAELVGESHHYADFAFAYGSDGRNSSPAFVSTVKLRQAGFTEVIDTEQMFVDLLRGLREQRILP
ncbi:SDR family oxidoreductase [Microbacterium chocolatum]|uniref:SDR family oxidoreductase n=1 Tax=Microbacterium aurantiacum TaxID=162393 RepID=UPI00338DB3CC